MSGGQIQTNSAGGIIYGEFVENSNIKFTAYLTKANGNVVDQADVEGFVAVEVYQRSGATPTTPVYTNSTYVSSTDAIAALSVDGWTRGGSGYNFSVTILASAFSQYGGQNYRFEFRIPLQQGGYITVQYELFCRGII